MVDVTLASLRLFDRLSGSNNLKYLVFFEDALNWTYDDLKKHQMSQLYSVHGITEDQFTNQPLRHKDFYDHFFGSFHPTKHVDLKYTSGSTGTPLAFYRPKEEPRVYNSLRWRWFLNHGIWRKRFLRMSRGSPPKSLITRIFNWLANIRQTDYFHIDNQTVNLFKTWKPEFMLSIVSGAYELARKLEAKNISGEKCTVFVGSESILPYEDILKGFYRDVFQHYGGAEFGACVACECPYHTLHVNMESQIVESVNGEIIVTNLANNITPFIRYRTGDRGQVERKKCKCGRETDVITDLEGRLCEYYMNPKGRDISWWLATPLTTYYHAVKKWRVIVNSKGITVEIIPRSNCEEAKRTLNPYVSWVENETNLDCLIECVDDISQPLKPQLLKIEI